MYKRTYALAFATLLTVGLSGAQAALVTQFGTNVSFTYDDSTLFGVGTVNGNNIFFTPDNFVAQSQNGAGLVTITDTLDIKVTSLDPVNFLLTNAKLTESGDYQISDFGTLGNASVRARATLGGSGLVAPGFGNAGSPFSVSDSFDTGVITTPTNSTDWTGSAMIGNFGGPAYHATELDITIENVLDADTGDTGDLANIAKKFVGNTIGLEINAVPVPAAVWLFASGLLGMVGMARRRKV